MVFCPLEVLLVWLNVFFVPQGYVSLGRAILAGLSAARRDSDKQQRCTTSFRWLLYRLDRKLGHVVEMEGRALCHSDSTGFITTNCARKNSCRHHYTSI